MSTAFPSITRWWFYQLFYAALMLTAFGMLWAVGQQPDFSSGLLFAFGLGNLNTIAIDLLRLRLSRQKPIVAWAMFTASVGTAGANEVSPRYGFVLLERYRPQ